MAKALSKARDTPVKNNLETSITYLKRPKFQWLTIQRLGTLGGGLNAGIATARFKHDPLDRVFVEKSFKTSDVEERIAHKEIALLKQVGDHMHITRMYDHFIDERARRACLYMEHCDKGSLLDVIMNCGSNQCVNEHNVWDWFIQILSALVYCHLGPRPEVESECLNWATIYHRDIKPANILLTRDKTKSRIIAKLADFGCATSDEWTFQTKDRATATHTSAQTPGFDPPEFPRYSGSSDVWQLALVFVCVCNRERASPRSRNNPRGKQWDRARPAGANYSRDLSLALGSCLIQDWIRRPGALKTYQSISGAYERLRRSVPANAHPCELVERIISPVTTAGNYLRLDGPSHVFQGPGARRAGRMLYNCADAQRYAQDPSLSDQILRGAMYSQGSWEDEHEFDDVPAHRVDLGSLGAQYQHRGYFPPFNPRLW